MDILNEIALLWWTRCSSELTNPKSEASIKALREVLEYDLELDNDFIEYVIETLTETEKDEDSDERELADADIQKSALTDYEKEALKENILIELGQILSEASIYDNKYAVGDYFMALKSTADLFKIGLPPSSKVPKGPFKKIAPTEDSIEVNINKGRTVYVSADDTKENYIITANDKTIQSLFGKMKKGASITDINFDTETLETAACMGLYVNGVGILNELNSANNEDDLAKVTNSIRDRFAKALGMSGEYAKPNEILNKMNTMPLGDYYLIAQLMAGMTKFTQNIVRFKPVYLIHKNIKQYYKATERSDLVDGVKDNTADCVVCNVPGTELISKLNEGLPVEYDKNGVCTIKGTNIKFLQISLKKAKDEAQLGKIYGFLKDKYGLLDISDVKKLALESVQLDENIRDFLNKGINFIKSLGSKFLEKISQIGNFLSSFLKRLESGLKKSPVSAIKKLESDLLKIGLNEGVLTENKRSIWDSFEKIGKNQKLLDKLVSNVNTELQSLLTVSLSNPAFVFAGYEKLQLKTPIDKDTVAKLLTNFQSAIVLKNIMGDLNSDAKTLYSQLISLEKEMIYGKTTLPLYKVYGLDRTGDGTPYEAYPGSEVFVQTKLAKDLSDTVVFYLKASSQQNMYFNLSGYGLTGINETTGDLKYSQFRMGTNTTGRYSYNFEGVKELPIGKVKKSLGIN